MLEKMCSETALGFFRVLLKKREIQVYSIYLYNKIRNQLQDTSNFKI